MPEPLTRKRYMFFLLLYVGCALVVLGMAPLVGSESISLARIGADLRQPAENWTVDTQIFVYQRVPRVVLGLLVGGSLALVGAVLQVILRNALAAPYTLGITGGASVGAVLAIYVSAFAFQLGPFHSVQLFALAGAGAALVLIYAIARRPEGLAVNTLLLAGVTVHILCGAVILLISYLTSPHLLKAMNQWLMGGLAVVGYQQLASLLPLLLPGLGVLLLQMASLNHLSLGHEMALGHGVDVSAVQGRCFFGAALATAAVVSLAGPIGFVGLLTPHAVRRLSGLDHRLVLPGSFLAGGAFLVVCDTLARTLLAPTEMPVGVITATLGGPFFIYLLLKRS